MKTIRIATIMLIIATTMCGCRIREKTAGEPKSKEQQAYSVSVDSESSTDEEQSIGFAYLVRDDGTASIYGLEADDYDAVFDTITVPEEIDGYTVVKIEDLFHEGINVKKVVLPKTLKVIGDKAFFMSPIEEIEIPSGVSKLESHAFSMCNNLKKLSFKEGLEEVSYTAIIACENLEELHLPASLKNEDGELDAKIDVITPKNVVIYAPEGSDAAAWAENKGVKVVYEGEPVTNNSVVDVVESTSSEMCEDDSERENDANEEFLEPGTIAYDYKNLEVKLDDIPITLRKTTPADLSNNGYTIEGIQDIGPAIHSLARLRNGEYSVAIGLADFDRMSDEPTPAERRVIYYILEKAGSPYVDGDYMGPYKVSINGFKVGENPKITWKEAVNDMFPSVDTSKPDSIEDSDLYTVFEWENTRPYGKVRVTIWHDSEYIWELGASVQDSSMHILREVLNEKDLGKILEIGIELI